MESLRVTHQPPSSGGIRRLIWKWRVRFESTFGLAMLEPWEVLLIWISLTLLTSLLYISISTYLPSHLAFLRRRFAYYVYGEEGANIVHEVGKAIRSQLGLREGKGEGAWSAGKVEWERWGKGLVNVVRSKAGFGEGVGMKYDL